MSPRNSSTALTDREGIALVGRIVTRDLGWFFREQHEVDQGVDGQVETADEGRGTGRLIALQIKTGPSYFKTVKGGWAFYYSERERQLWLGHALPVMVVLVDLASDTAYWQRISTSTERRTNKKYAVTVPADQTLGTAAAEWELAASGMEQRAAERYSANLEVLPPPVRRLIEKEGAGAKQAQLVALHLAEGRDNPVGTAQALMTARPHWMTTETTDSWSWRALASYCAHHGAMRESADASEIAAEAGGNNRGKLLAIAALHILSEDKPRARRLMEAAREHGGADVLVAIIEAVLEHPEGDALPLRTDAVVTAGGAGVSADGTAQSFLAEQAFRARDFATAARHAERALAIDPDGTDEMARAARVYALRSFTADAQADDLARAVGLLSDAIEQRRGWAGPTIELLLELARGLFVRGEHDAMLRWLLQPPYGTASSREANDPRLLRYVLAAAHASGDSELVASVMAQMSCGPEDRLVQMRLGLLELPNSELKEFWTEALARSEAEQDWEVVAQSVYRLASLGVDATEHLVPLMRDGILPSGSERLPRALVVLHHRPEDGLVLLRPLASEDVNAADELINALVSAKRTDDAAAACAAAFERFLVPRYLTWRAMLLFDDKRDSRAQKALSEALQAEEASSDRLAIATRLAHLEATAGNLPRAESILTTALGYREPPPDSLLWSLVEVQLAGPTPARAAGTISRHRPQCRTADDARLWGRAMVTVAWDEAIASEAISLAARFSTDDPQLATGLLTHLVVATRGASEGGKPARGEGLEEPAVDQTTDPVDDRPAVPGELHRRAFEALDDLVEKHGSATGVQVFRASSTEEMMQQVTEVARSYASPDLTVLYDQIAQGLMPAGMVALHAGKPYTAALVQRAAGQLVAVAVDDAEHEDEADVAAAARDGQVVVDLSTVLLLSQLSDADAIAGQVSGMLQPRSARDDMLRAAVDAQSLAASSGTLGWSSRGQRPVFYEKSQEEDRLIRERTNAMENVVRRTAIKDLTSSALFSETPDEIKRAPWLSAIELAAQEGLPLWCDDLAVRRLARGVGVKAFSTWAMAEVLRDARIESARDPEDIEDVIQFAARIVSQLLHEYVVDLPVTFEQIVTQAREDDWVPAAAAVAISRPAWWAWQPNPIQEVLRLYMVIRKFDASQVRGWQTAVMLGAARSRATPEDTRRYLAVMALLGSDHRLNHEPEFEDLVEGCRNARRVADSLDDVGDPMLALPLARQFLGELGVARSEELVQSLIAELGPSNPET